MKSGKNWPKSLVRRNMKRVLAWIGIIVITLLTLAVLIGSLLNIDTNILFTLIFFDIAIPICLYAFFLITKFLKKK